MLCPGPAPLICVLLLASVTAGARSPWPNPFLRRRDDGQWSRWCGKHYQAGSPADSDVVEAGWTPVPETSDSPLLDFRCSPTIQPYLEDDTYASFVIDANVSYTVGQAFSGSASTSNSLSVFIHLTDSPSTTLASTTIPVNSLLNEVSFDLTSLSPSTDAYNVTCSAKSSDTSETYEVKTKVYRMPANPYGGSVTKMDRRTGGMLRNDSGKWESFMPFGFYTFTDDVIANLSVIDAMANDGWNVIHLVPSYYNTSLMSTILNHADNAGILYMADFRDIYENQTAVSAYVDLFRSRKNLLAWYTSDESDGPGDPGSYVTDDYNLFYSMDGYHPVSLVLNCYDFHWNDYTVGADIVLADTYPIAVNTTFSKRYGTVCNETYGCCGCDDCTGQLSDITHKLDVWSDRRSWIGRTRELAIWNVPQAFNGTEEFWTRVPTGAEFKLQTILGANHGAIGIMPWDNPYDTPEIAQAAREISPIFSKSLAPIILNHTYTRNTLTSDTDNVDVSAWSPPSSSDGASHLILVGNMNYDEVTASIDVGSGSVDVLFGDGEIQGGQLVVSLESTGVAGFMATLQGETLGKDKTSSASARSHGMGVYGALLMLTTGVFFVG